MASNTIIAIVGPTASGKTSLAIELAERWNGEIICADSRTVYKGMDIGTAKPTAEEQTRVRHWGLDLVEPNQPFTVADFKQYADEKITDIHSRGKVVFIVGGTGLYVDAVMYNFTFGRVSDRDTRLRYESMGIEQLIDYSLKNNVKLPENVKNKRHLIHAIERKSISTISRSPLEPQSYIVGITTNSKTLRTRITQRTEQLFKDNVEKEATILGEKYGWNSEAMTGNIYPLLKLHLEGEIDLDEVKERFTTLDYRLAKRQMTWLRRNPDIMWTRLTEAKAYVHSLLAAE